MNESKATKFEQLNFKTPAFELKKIAKKQGGAKRDSFNKGVTGEEIVASLLGKFKANLAVFHSIPLIKSKKDIDHLVIYGNEAILINTKNYNSKRILLDGDFLIYNRRKSYDMVDLKRDAYEVEKILNVKVTPVLVVANNSTITIREKPVIEVCNLKMLERKLENLKGFDISLAKKVDNPVTWGLKESVLENKQERDGYQNYYQSSVKEKIKYALGVSFMLYSLLVLLNLIGNAMTHDYRTIQESNSNGVSSSIKESEKYNCYVKATTIAGVNSCDVNYNNLMPDEIAAAIDVKKIACEINSGELAGLNKHKIPECSIKVEECLSKAQDAKSVSACKIEDTLKDVDNSRYNNLISQKISKCESFGMALVYDICERL